MIQKEHHLTDGTPRRSLPVCHKLTEYEGTEADSSDVCDHTMWLEMAAYAEYERLSTTPMEDAETIGLLCKYLAILTRSTIVIVDLDEDNRILRVAGHPVDYLRLALDDWYKVHLLGTETPSRRIIAMKRDPLSSISENRLLLHGLSVLSGGIPTIYCLYDGFKTYFVEKNRIHTQQDAYTEEKP